LAKDKYKKQIFIRLLELFICKDMSELQPIVIPSASLLPNMLLQAVYCPSSFPVGLIIVIVFASTKKLKYITKFVPLSSPTLMR
jgi:hypothetical protein